VDDQAFITVEDAIESIGSREKMWWVPYLNRRIEILAAEKKDGKIPWTGWKEACQRDNAAADINRQRNEAISADMLKKAGEKSDRLQQEDDGHHHFAP
jgi:hypothetical protein